MDSYAFKFSCFSTIHFIKFPRGVWIKQADKSDIYDEKNLIFLFLGVLVEREGKELHTLLLLQNREGKPNAVHVVLFYERVENFLTKVDTVRHVLPLLERRVKSILIM